MFGDAKKSGVAQLPSIKVAIVGGRACGKTTLLGCLMEQGVESLDDGSTLRINLYDEASQAELRPIWEQLKQGDSIKASAAISYRDIRFRVERFGAGPSLTSDTADSVDKWNIVTRDYAGRFMEYADVPLPVKNQDGNLEGPLPKKLVSEVREMLDECQTAVFLFPVNQEDPEKHEATQRYFNHLDVILEAIRLNGAGRDWPAGIALTKWDLLNGAYADPEAFLEQSGVLRERVRSIQQRFPNAVLLPVSAYGVHDPDDPGRPVQGHLRPMNVLRILEMVCRGVTELRKNRLKETIAALPENAYSKRINAHKAALPTLAPSDRREQEVEIDRLAKLIRERSGRYKRRVGWTLAALILFSVTIGAWWQHRQVVKMRDYLDRFSPGGIVDPVQHEMLAAYRASQPFVWAERFLSDFRQIGKRWDDLDRQLAFQHEAQALQDDALADPKLWLHRWDELRKRYPVSERPKAMESHWVILDTIALKKNQELERNREIQQGLLALINDDNRFAKERLRHAKELLAKMEESARFREENKVPDAAEDQKLADLRRQIGKLEKWTAFEEDFDWTKNEMDAKPSKAEKLRIAREFREKYRNEEYRYPPRETLFAQLKKMEDAANTEIITEKIGDLQKKADTEYQNNSASDTALKAYTDLVATLKQPVHANIQGRDVAELRLDIIQNNRDANGYKRIQDAWEAEDSAKWLDNVLDSMEDYLELENNGVRKYQNSVKEWRDFLGQLRKSSWVTVRLYAIDITGAISYSTKYYKLQANLVWPNRKILVFDGRHWDKERLTIPKTLLFEGNEYFFFEDNDRRVVFSDTNWTLSENLNLSEPFTVQLINHRVSNSAPLWMGKSGTIWLYRLAIQAGKKGVHTVDIPLFYENAPDKKALLTFTFYGFPKYPEAPLPEVKP